MNIIQGIFDTYAQFFHLSSWEELFTHPAAWGIIGTLIILEGLLSADNALVLAVMVKHLPPEKRKKALFYGLIGAYAFRFIAIGLGVYLVKLWWVKALGAGYLMYLVVKYFIDKSKPAEDEDEDGVDDRVQKSVFVRMFGMFWGTVAMVEMMDIAFSVDSVLAAFGVSDLPVILLIGGMLGILMMRGVAQAFLWLLDRVQELETTAYLIIAVISIKMFLGVLFHYEMSHNLFFIILLVMFAATFVVHFINKGKKSKDDKLSA